MKRKRTYIVILLTAGTLLWSQSFSEPMLRRSGLADEKIQAVLQVEENHSQLKREAQVEQNFYKAQLERLLLNPEPDMDDVEEILRNSMEWKLKETMGDIDRRVKIRKILGEEAWAKLVKAARELQKRNAEQNNPQG